MFGLFVVSVFRVRSTNHSNGHYNRIENKKIKIEQNEMRKNERIEQIACNDTQRQIETNSSVQLTEHTMEAIST